MKLHYSQTTQLVTEDWQAFDYLMKLHYSQTGGDGWWGIILFDYLMKLHYSQTRAAVSARPWEFDYLMKLHYSQTQIMRKRHYTPCNFTSYYDYSTVFPWVQGQISPAPAENPQFLKDLAEIPVNNADGFLFRTILQMALHQQNLQFPADGIP